MFHFCFFRRYVFNPSLTSADDAENFRFLGVLMGVAIRTKKPLDLHLAPIVWKMLAGEVCFADARSNQTRMSAENIVLASRNSREKSVLAA